MTDQEIVAVYRCLFGPGAEVQNFSMTVLECATALLIRYPRASSIDDIFVRGDLSEDWRAGAYAMFGVDP